VTPRRACFKVSTRWNWTDTRADDANFNAVSQLVSGQERTDAFVFECSKRFLQSCFVSVGLVFQESRSSLRN
jgi:hypothetical protein